MEEKDKIISAISQLEYNVNFERSVIYLEGEIDTYSAPFVLERINIIRDLRNLSDKDNPINLYITSPGGDVNGLTALVDIIDSLKCKINTYGVGHIASAAVWILAAGTGTRYIAPNAEVMIHELSAWLRGTTSDVENEARQIKAVQQNLFRLLGKFSKKDSAYWIKQIKEHKNLYLTPDKCIELGLVDQYLDTNTI